MGLTYTIFLDFFAAGQVDAAYRWCLTGKSLATFVSNGFVLSNVGEAPGNFSAPIFLFN